MGRPRSYDREEVLRRAMGLFWRKGYEGAHLQELVEVAGINRFSLYKEFGGKEGLFRAAIELYLGELADLGALLTREPLGLDNILALLHAESRERFHHGCFALNTLSQKYVVPAESFEAIQGLITSMEQGFRRNLEAARERGEITGEVDGVGLARLLAVLNIGMLSYEIYSPNKRARTSVLRALSQLLGRDSD